MISYLESKRPWIDDFFVRPYQEGWERLLRAWHGVDFHTLARKPLDPKTRIISLLSGLYLLLPFVNAIVWIAMDTFGRREFLTDRPVRRSAAAPPPAPPPALPIVHVPPAAAAAGAPSFRYRDTTGGVSVDSDWRIEGHQVTKTASDGDVAVSLYDEHGNIQEYRHARRDGLSLLIQLVAPGKIAVTATHSTGNKRRIEHTLAPGRPWVQQPTLGLKRFFASRDTTFLFYGIHPSELTLIPLVATKKEASRIEVTRDWVPTWVWKSQIWYDAATHVLLRMEASPGPRTPVTLTEMIPLHG